jgi:hypothetical protein
LLTNTQVREIKRRLIEGDRGIGIQLAREYGVSKATISCIKSGRAWSKIA